MLHIKFTLLLITFIFLQLLSPLKTYAQSEDANLVLHMDFNGNTVDSISGRDLRLMNDISSYNDEISYYKDRNDIEGAAVGASEENHNFDPAIIDFPLESKDLPQVTITMWIMSDVPNPYVDIINMRDNTTRGLSGNPEGINMDCGRDGLLKGESLVPSEWNFIACVYDFEAEEARLVINDTVYAKMAKTKFTDVSSFTLGLSHIHIDDLRIYDGVLPLNELEKIYGSPIQNNSDAYQVINRYAEASPSSYRENTSPFLDFSSAWTYVILVIVLAFIVVTVFLDKFDVLLPKLPFGTNIDAENISKMPLGRRLTNIYPAIILGVFTTFLYLFREEDAIWFFSGGFSFIPQNYDRINHWLMYGMTLFTFVMLIMYLIYSIVHVGFLGGLIRFAIILFGNFLALLLTVVLTLALTIIVVFVIGSIIAVVVFFEAIRAGINSNSNRRYYYD